LVLAATGVVIVLLAVRALLGKNAAAESASASGTRSGMGATGRPRIRLRPCANPIWTNLEAARNYADQLHELGFQDVGSFFIDGAGYFVRGFVKPDEATWATLEEMTSIPGLWVEVAVVLDDGNLYSISNRSRPPLFSALPGTVLRREPGVDAAGLYRKMLAERPAGPLRPASAEAFVAMYEDYQNRVKDWLSLRGGMNEDELRALADQKGVDASDAQIAQWRERQQRTAWEHVRQMVAERYFATAGLSDDDERRMTRLLRRGLLVVVGDTMPMRALSHLFGKSVEEVNALLSERAEGGLCDEWLDAEPRIPIGKWPPREAFIALNDRLPEARRFHRIATMDEPIPCDLYATAHVTSKSTKSAT
jgi:hypothetical protein